MVNVPPPPYYYNDPRFTYDEHCMLYNGGFDIQCLIGVTTTPRIIVGKGGGTTQRPKDKKTIIELKIISNLYSVNDNIVDFEDEQKNYNFEHDEVKISLNKFIQRKNNIEVNGSLTNESIKEIKFLPIQTIVSGSFVARKKQNSIVITSRGLHKKNK